jgi:hypothetical protein
VSSTNTLGRLDFLVEGYYLSWDRDALVVTVTEYDASPLRLPWRLLLDLAEKAKKPQAASNPGDEEG